MPTIDVLLDGTFFRAADGIVGFCSVVLIEGEYRTLVDVGHVGRRNAVLKALAERNLGPDDIDYAIVSHAHWDHAQNFDAFPNATMLIHPWERRYAGAPHPNDWATPRWTGAMIEQYPVIREVEESDHLEDGVWFAHAPGHSPGSVVTMVETDDGRCAVTSDVLHVARAALERRNPSVFWNEEDAVRSIDRVVGEADVIYPGHDRPFRIVDGEVVYLRDLSINLLGLDPATPGVRFDPAPVSSFVMPGIEEQSVDAFTGRR